MSQKTVRPFHIFQKALKRFLKVINCTQQLQVRENVMRFEKALGAVKVIKDQIQYRSQSLFNSSRDYFRSNKTGKTLVNSGEMQSSSSGNIKQIHSHFSEVVKQEVLMKISFSWFPFQLIERLRNENEDTNDAILQSIFWKRDQDLAPKCLKSIQSCVFVLSSFSFS